MGAWVSLDKYGWDEKHLEGDALVYLKNQILISHDAGWYTPSHPGSDFKPYTNIFQSLIPNLKAKGFTDEDINQPFSPKKHIVILNIAFKTRII